MEPGVVDVFSKLWETNELIVAFDGFNISFPNRKDTQWSPWPHCDQSPNRRGYGFESRASLTLGADTTNLLK